MNTDKTASLFLDSYEKPAYIDEVGLGCERPDAEILTKKGWKTHTQLDKTDSVLSFTDKGRIIWQNIDAIIIKHYCGPLLELKNRGIHIAVTPDHSFDVLMRISKRLQSKKEITVGYKVVRKNVTELMNNDCIPRGGLWRGSALSHFTLPAFGRGTKKIKIPMKKWTAFLGIYLSKGSTWSSKDNGDYRIMITQRKGASYKKIEKMLQDLPFNFKEIPNGFCCWNQQLHHYMDKFGHAINKHVPPYVKGLTSELLETLLEWLVLGDGHIQERKGRKPHTTYYTSSPKLKDDIEEILLKTGHSYHTYLIPKEKMNGRIRGRLVQATTDGYAIGFRRNIRAYAKFFHQRSYSYDGDVFCLRLKKYHNFFVRRNGTGYFTGNSIFGELVACAVMIPKPFRMKGVDDSKKLKHDDIYRLAPKLKKKVQYAFGIVTPEELNEIRNMVKADQLAMKRAVEALPKTPDAVFVDGRFPIKDLGMPTHPVVKGDARIFGIAVASIIAKDHRDHLIIDKYGKAFDKYDLFSNKGYRSPKHLMAIRKYGTTPHHRLWLPQVTLVVSGDYDVVIQRRNPYDDT